MSIDVAATAKTFEKHAADGYIPEILSREMQTLDPADRLAVAKQITWDMAQQQNSSLPKLEFYDSGELKAIEKHTKNGDNESTDRVVLYKDSASVKAELNINTQTENGHSRTFIDYHEKDEKGHITKWAESSSDVSANSVSASSFEQNNTYDAKTGKQISHDEITSSGKKLHAEYDGQTGFEKFEDQSSPSSKAHRTFDPATGKIRQEDIVNADGTTTKNLYTSNGDLRSSEEHLKSGNTRTTIYRASDGSKAYVEITRPDGTVLDARDYDEKGNSKRHEN